MYIFWHYLFYMDYGREAVLRIHACLPHTQTHTHTCLTALFPRLPRWAGNRKVKPIWILLKQETVSGSGISWAICKSAPSSRHVTMPAPYHSVFYRLDALPAAQPTASKHWRPACMPTTLQSYFGFGLVVTFVNFVWWMVCEFVGCNLWQLLQGGPKKRTVFRLDNFVMVSPRKACSMSKFSQFYREKGGKLAF